MGILIPISKHVNGHLKEAHKKPLWAATEPQKRAIRYANAYTKNAKAVHRINGITTKCSPGIKI